MCKFSLTGHLDPPPVCVSRMHLTHFGAETHPPRSVSVLSPGGVFQTRGEKDTMASPMPPAPRLLACWFFDVWFLVIFLFNFPAEMRVGSLVSGCLFSDHFLPIAVILDTDTVIFGASNLSFGDVSILAPWGSIERFRGTWEQKKGYLGRKRPVAYQYWSHGNVKSISSESIVHESK